MASFLRLYFRLIIIYLKNFYCIFHIPFTDTGLSEVFVRNILKRNIFRKLMCFLQLQMENFKMLFKGSKSRQERWSKNWVTILYCTQLHRNAMLYTNTKQFWEPKEVIFPLSFKEILLTKKEKKSQQTCNNLPWPSEKWGRRK